MVQGFLGESLIIPTHIDNSSYASPITIAAGHQNLDDFDMALSLHR